MKFSKIAFSVSVAILFVAFSGKGHASLFQPGWYGNFHLGSTDTSLNAGNQEFSYLSIGGAIGYQFNPIMGAEFYMSFASNGERDEIVSALLGQEVKTEFNAVGLYLTAKNPGDIYVKGRLGITESRFIYSSKGYEDEAGKDAGLSYGLGVGMMTEDVSLELEYLVMPEVGDPLFTSDSYDTNQIVLSIGTRF